jgi:hypothetical protein
MRHDAIEPDGMNLSLSVSMDLVPDTKLVSERRCLFVRLLLFVAEKAQRERLKVEPLERALIEG